MRRLLAPRHNTCLRCILPILLKNQCGGLTFLIVLHSRYDEVTTETTTTLELQACSLCWFPFDSEEGCLQDSLIFRFDEGGIPYPNISLSMRRGPLRSLVSFFWWGGNILYSCPMRIGMSPSFQIWLTNEGPRRVVIVSMRRGATCILLVV